MRSNTPGVLNAINIVGFSGATFTNAPNAGAIFLILDRLRPSARRIPAQSAAGIQGALFGKYAAIREAFLIVVQPPPVQGIGNAGGFRMMVEDRAGRGPQALAAGGRRDDGHARRTTPGLMQVFSLFEISTPQLYLDIDRTKAQLLGINMPDVFNALQVNIGSSYVNDFNLFGRTFRVQAQADVAIPARAAGHSRICACAIRRGETVPLGSFTTIRDITGPYRVPRYNIYPAAELDGAAAPGYSQGQAIEIMEKLAAETLPRRLRL